MILSGDVISLNSTAQHPSSFFGILTDIGFGLQEDLSI